MNSEAIWLNYQSDIRRFILSKVQDTDDAKDLLQDVFIKLHSNINSVSDQTKVKAWLFQITRNVVNDYFRNQKLFISRARVDIPQEVENSSINEQFSNCVLSHVDKLPEKYKQALVKIELQNCSQLKLANELNISYSALKSRVQRGRKILQEYLKACCNISADKYGNIVSVENKSSCSVC